DCGAFPRERMDTLSSRSPDIIVVGAGIIGCAVAYELARRGASVQIIDERAAGHGATHASAGMLAPYVEADVASALLDLTVRSLDLFDDFVARVEADGGGIVPYRRTGTLQVAVDADRMIALTETASRLHARGVERELLDANGARAHEPHLGDDVVGAM